MSRNRDIERILAASLVNPFAEGVDREGAARALERLDVPAALADLVRDKDLERAKSLVLAVGHARACRLDSPAAALGEDVLPRSIARALPRPRGDYLRVVAAAGRCYRALSAVRGTSEEMQRARRDTWAACFGDSLRHALDLERVIRDHDVLILGETGTGKEKFARAIQLATPGGDKGEPAPAAAINAAAIPDTLVESELFGHVKGAFTGASDTRTGKLRSADGGAFFLDEVGDLPATTQVKFLRVIETNEVYPLGSDTSTSVDVRYLAATHKDLEAMVERREFRRDLYERLAGKVLRIPPLRERPDDIVEIGRHFVQEYVERTGGRIGESDAIVAWLGSREARNHPWPGNVRELQNVLRNLLLGLDPGLRAGNAPAAGAAPDPSLPRSIRDGDASMQQVSDWYLRHVLDRAGGNYTRAAQVLGIDRSTVRRRMRALA